MLEIGDIVMLNSGGPWMTVVQIWKSGKVDCRWFSEENCAQDDNFPGACVHKRSGVPG